MVNPLGYGRVGHTLILSCRGARGDMFRWVLKVEGWWMTNCDVEGGLRLTMSTVHDDAVIILWNGRTRSLYRGVLPNDSL
jgi:hypothetical protein